MRWALDRELAWATWEPAHRNRHIRLLNHPRVPLLDTTKVHGHLAARQIAIYDRSRHLDTEAHRHSSMASSKVSSRATADHHLSRATVDHHLSTDMVGLSLPKATVGHLPKVTGARLLPATDHRQVSGVVDLRRLRVTRDLAMENSPRRNRVVILLMDSSHMDNHRMDSHHMGSRRMVVVVEEEEVVVDTGTSQDEGKGL